MVEIGGVLIDPKHVIAVSPGIFTCSLLMTTGDWLAVNAPFSEVKNDLMAAAL
jgi:hypothetical protein